MMEVLPTPAQRARYIASVVRTLAEHGVRVNPQQLPSGVAVTFGELLAALLVAAAKVVEPARPEAERLRPEVSIGVESVDFEDEADVVAPCPEDEWLPLAIEPEYPPESVESAEHGEGCAAHEMHWNDEASAGIEVGAGVGWHEAVLVQPRTYEVWFGTNRAPKDGSDPASGFDNCRDPRGVVHYGKCCVTIPRSHVFATVGTPWWKRWLSLRFEDDHLKLQKIAIMPDEASFFDSVRAELASIDASDRHVLVYLHGYHAGFEEAAIRAAQIGFDLKIRGVTAFFSWPSCASVEGYFVDGERIGASEVDIAAFLTAIVRSTGAERVHLLAHSMGNRGLARALQRITAQAASASGVRFWHIILAAPDMEVTLFTGLAKVYPTISERTTMYVSARDKALELSKWLQGSDRAGYTPPVTVVPGIDTIEVTDIDLTMLGHSYYAEAEGVLHDIYDLLNFDAPPDLRARTRLASKNPKYWAIAR